LPLILCIVVGFLSRPYFSLQPWMGLAGGVFLFLSSWEFNPRALFTEGRLLLKIWLGAFFLPFFVGLALPSIFPSQFTAPAEVGLQKTSLLLGIAMAVSAVPVIIKIMQELGWAGTLRAQRIVLTAVLCDITAWIFFFPLLPSQSQSSWLISHQSLLMFFLGLLLTLIFPSLSRPRRPLKLLNQWLIAPIFFVGVGQNLDFTHGFNLTQIVIVLVVATIAKVCGTWIAARLAKLDAVESKATALALNARGAMEIIMANLALKQGLITHDLFLSLVIMAVVTSGTPFHFGMRRIPKRNGIP